MTFTHPPFKTRADLAGLKITIMGLGLNGGGLASARFFSACGAKVTVTDTKTAQELAPSIQALSDHPDIRYVLGTHEISDFSTADLVIKNPAVKLQGNKYLATARAIETDISVFLRFSPAPILAVSGSKGKSSTVSALQYGLKQLGLPALLGGNITVSPLSFLDQTTEHTPVVLELSSWQLADLKGRGLLRARVAIMTPIMPDHQNWYGGMESYVADKKLLYADMTENSDLLCNRDDHWGRIFAQELQANKKGPRVHWYSSHPLENETPGSWIEKDGSGYMRTTPNAEAISILPADLAVPGIHMRQNLLTAAQAMVLYGCDPAQTARALSTFPGIPHRLEFFHESNGIKLYNDSAATIPEAVAAALSSFDSPVILLTGGTDKNLDFIPLADAAHLAKKIYLLAGSGTDKLIPMLNAKKIPFYGPFPGLAELLHAAHTGSASGDRIVFSPGATSFGLFLNEFDRGNKFKQAAQEIFS